MCAASYPSVPAIGTISSNVPAPPKETRKLVAAPISNLSAPVVFVSLAATDATSQKTATAPSSQSKNFEAAFGNLSSQYGFGGAAPKPVSSLTSSSTSNKSAKKSWLKRPF